MFYVDHDRQVYEALNERLDNRNHIILPSYMSNDGYWEEYGVRVGPYVNSFAVEHNTWYFEFPNGDIDTLSLLSGKPLKKVDKKTAVSIEGSSRLV